MGLGFASLELEVGLAHCNLQKLRGELKKRRARLEPVFYFLTYDFLYFDQLVSDGGMFSAYEITIKGKATYYLVLWLIR